VEEVEGESIDVLRADRAGSPAGADGVDSEGRRPVIAGTIGISSVTGASSRDGVPARPQDAAGDSVSIDEQFEKAVLVNARRLVAVARGIVGNAATAEDVVQQAMLNLYTHRHRYDWREPGGLMRRTVVNESLRLLRQPRPTYLPDDQSGPDDDAHSPAGAMIENETVTTVRRAVDKLPPNHRAALVLCEYENMSYAQIADELGASIPQVKTWIHRARRQLEGLLKEFAETK